MSRRSVWAGLVGFVAGLVAVVALAQPKHLNIGGQGGHLNVPLGGALLYVATSGRSQPTSIDSAFCTTYASEMTGDAGSCMSGGGDFTGNLGSFPDAGNPVDSNTYVCPNGTTCAQYASQRFGASDYYIKTAAVSPAGDFSACAFGIPDATGWKILVSKYDQTNDKGFLLGISSSNVAIFRVGKSSVSYTDVTSVGTTISIGEPRFICGTYDYVADGSSVMRLYLDGVEVGTASTTAVGPMGGAAESWAIGRDESAAGALQWLGRVGPVFTTEKVLSAATISNMAASMLPDLKDSRGTSVSTTRASIRSCIGGTSTNAYGSILQANRECVDSDNRLHVWGSHSNLVTRSTELEQWTAAGTPTESANSGTAPEGTRTADLIGDDDGAGLEGETNTATVSAGAAYTLSCYAAAGTSSTGHLVLDGTACPFTLTGSNFNRVSCTDASSSGVSITAEAYPTSSTVGDTGTMWFTDCQVNSGSVAAPFVPTYATAPVTAAADNAQITGLSLPIGLTPSFSFDYTPQEFTNADYLLAVHNGANDRWQIYQGAGGTVWCSYYDGASGSKQNNTALSLGTTYRVVCKYDGTNLSVCINGTCQSSAVALTPDAATYGGVSLGVSVGGSSTSEAFISNVCIGNTPEKCQ